jgi:eukaryotic-like serine/threonine-protein kinase
MFRVNFQRTGSENTNSVRQFQGVKWKVKKDCTLCLGSAPVVIDSMLYLLSLPGCLEALEIQSGQSIWKLDLETDSPSQLTFHEKIIYITGKNGYICAVDIQTKRQKWISKTGTSYNSDPVIIENVICVSDTDGYLYGLNLENGQSLWTFQPTAYMKMTPPAVNDGVVYVGSYNGSLYAVDATNGRIKWQIEIGSLDIDAVPMVSECFIYIVTKRNIIYVVNANEGEMVQQIKVGVEPTGRLSSLAIVDRVIYVEDFGSFYAINIQSGQEIWKVHSTQYSFINNFIVADNGLYSGSTGAVHALDLKTGNELWKFIVPDSVGWVMKPELWINQIVNFIMKIFIGIPWNQYFNCPVISNGVVYVSCTDGYFYALH